MKYDLFIEVKNAILNVIFTYYQLIDFVIIIAIIDFMKVFPNNKSSILYLVHLSTQASPI